MVKRFLEFTEGDEHLDRIVTRLNVQGSNMTPFRDEQVALLERVARLEDELREARGAEANQARVREELRALTERIERAKARGDADGNELDDLRAAVDRIRANLGDGPAPEKERGNDGPTAGLVLGLLAGAALLIAGVVFIARREDAPAVTKPADPTSVTEARAAASKAGHPASDRLLKVEARYVSSDGMLHANPAYYPKVDFVFAATRAPEPASSIPRPIGAPDDPMKMFRNEYTVSLSPSDARIEDQMFMLGIKASVPDPHCRLADVWKAALGAGAPAEAVAVIEYADGFVDSGARRGSMSRMPRWHFTISSTPPFSVDISDSDCSVMR